MEAFKIEGTSHTPTINFDGNAGVLEIRGRSIPANPIEFYAKVLAWIDDYGKTPCPETKVVIGLEYFNTSSSKILMDIFRGFERVHNSGKTNLLIVWQYEEEDEDMRDAGIEFQEIMDVNMTIEEVADLS